MDTASPVTVPEVSIIVPARNEEVNLGDCLQSLVSQDGVAFEIIVVDDGSTDRTKEIAESFRGVQVISTLLLPPGWTGKNNALVTGVRQAHGAWLLFTDADTVHRPGSLARALAEAKANEADMLSYSPAQIAVTFWEKAVLPAVFSELARQYPPQKVSDRTSPIAAANGQYILVRRDAYEAVGGHAAMRENLLEDVTLARAFKASGRRIRFRYAADAVRTRMYHNFRQLREGWTKNLALLFPQPRWLATWIAATWASSWIVLSLGLPLLVTGHWRTTYCAVPWFLLYNRVSSANFGVGNNLVATSFGMPMFAYLLVRSKRSHAKGSVSWKGRTYTEARGIASDPTLSNRTSLSRLASPAEQRR